jgi:plasmid stabilization system protein ParE
MKYRVLFAPAASKDLEDIFIYLMPVMGLDRARAYVSEIEAHCRGFSTFPKRGSRRDDLWPELRLVGYRRKVTIAFQVKGEVVRIIRVFHRGREVRIR